MKNTMKKNNMNASILTFLFLFFFLGNSQWGSAQTKDPLIVEKDKVEINNNLQVNGDLQTNLKATFGGDLSAKGATFSGNLTVQGATFTAKNATITGNINNANIGVVNGHNDDWAGFSHKDITGVGDYGLLHHRTGRLTLLNIAPGNNSFIGFRVNNVDKMVIRDNGNVGIGTTSPIANLDISSGGRTGNHPSSVTGLYVTGNFGPASNGVEFRHSNGSQGIGFGFNSIYATGTNGNQNLNLIPKGLGGVGIGTVEPQAILHVAGGAFSPSHGYVIGKALWNSQNNVYSQPVDFSNVSILADGDVLSKTKFISLSDIRIKKNIRLSSTMEDLKVLKAIEIVNYEMIDNIADNRMYKKVIAQQLEEVYPIAVQQATQGFIPSVFQPSISFDKITTGEYQLVVAKEHHLAVNDKLDLKCYPGNSSVIAEVIRVISPKEFVVQSTTELDNMESIFVYGKQVDDLLSVDYDAISMLNVSATQELAKQTEQLQAENQALTARVAELEKQVESMDELKASVAQLQVMMQGQTTVVSSASVLKK